MDPALKKEFSEKYGVEVNEVNFDNLEAMVVKLRSGAQYDLIWPSTEYVARLAAEGLLPQVRPGPAARTRTTSRRSTTARGGTRTTSTAIPYTYYTTGIAWRDDEVSGMTGSWNDLSNPDGEGRMFILDDFQEAIGEANLINGFDLNTAGPGRARDLEGDAARAEGERPRVLDQLRAEPGLRAPRSIHQAWNGDIVNVRNQVDDPENYKYETCEEGVPVGTDLMCIPVTARSPGTAMLFMDWIIEPENAARNVMWNGYPQPVEGGQQAFAEARQGGALDRRRPRGARDQRARVPARRPRGPPALDRHLHRGEGVLR